MKVNIYIQHNRRTKKVYTKAKDIYKRKAKIRQHEYLIIKNKYSIKIIIIKYFKVKHYAI